MVYAGFEKAIKDEAHPEWFGVLIDEMYGAELLKRAKHRGVTVSVTTEQSGQKEYHFEYGHSFLSHLDTFKPAYAKALVRYNPVDTELNKRQLTRIAQLSKACKKRGYGLLLELLVPPTEQDIARAGSKAAFDQTLRHMLTAQAIKEIKRRVRVDVWKLEGMSTAGWKTVLAALGPDARVIVLGRGEGAARVREWLTDAARFDQIIGFAVGRTIFAAPLGGYLKKRLTKDQAISRIASSFKKYVNLWKRAKGL